MASRDHWDIRTLLDGHQALRALLGNCPASAITPALLIKLSRADRQLRPVGELTTARRQALADEFSVILSPDQTHYMAPPGDDGKAKYKQFQDGMAEWLATPYPLEFEPIPWDEAIQGLRGMSALHYTLMPFLFEIGQGAAMDLAKK